MKRHHSKIIVVLGLSLFTALVSAGCSKKSTSNAGNPNTQIGTAPESVPSAQTGVYTGPVIEASAIPVGNAEIFTLSNGAEITIQNLAGRLYTSVEGTFDTSAMQKLIQPYANRSELEKKTVVQKAMQDALSKIDQSLHIGGASNKSKWVIEQSFNARVGYFRFLLAYEPDLGSTLKRLSAENSVILSPIWVDRQSLKNIKAHTPAEFELETKQVASSRANTEGFSGLNRMGYSEFLKLAKADIGGDVEIDGSTVKIGITDTGITYNHPIFESKLNPGKKRVVYLKDFTREGRIYFNPKAAFSATQIDPAVPNDFMISAEVIVTPKLPNKPVGDQLVAVKDLRVHVSDELRMLLLSPDSHAKLGVLLEDSLQSKDDVVDVNKNGKLNDKFFTILIPGATPASDVVYFDATGTGDFRESKSLHSFNSSTETMEVFAEKIGFDLTEDKLADAAGTGTITVRAASLVGYDPGNHGTHVAGIAAGGKVIANDPDDTLAKGVASEAAIYMNRVCSNNAGCNETEAFVDLATNGGVDVINMSLGGLSPMNDGYGVTEALINRLTTLTNTLFVISAGNEGPGIQTVGSPSTAQASLSIGASANPSMIERQYQYAGIGGSATTGLESPAEDFMLFFSSRGPTASGGFKPNIVAPGTELSSIQLNSAPGGAAGMSVYWGTSMAAPAATGAYALLLDAARKYNAAHADSPLPTQASVLRQVLIESARPFDTTRLDVSTGRTSVGQYTWIDQGVGMLNLPEAWKTLMSLRTKAVASAVTVGTKSVELEYPIYVSSKMMPSHIPYDGSRPQPEGASFANGLYLTYADTDTLKPVYIGRRLPEVLAQSAIAGQLSKQLVTTKDVFEIRTVISGSTVQWLKAGVLDHLDCATANVSNELTVLSEGATLLKKADGSAELVPLPASTLFVCLDREVINTQLTAGDHGALIYGYRKNGTQVSPIPSFVVPVSLTVPHLTLNHGTGYSFESSVKGFGVSRNYIQVPKGTSVLRVTLEVPELKPGVACSAVNFTLTEGVNTVSAFASNPGDARAANCTREGRPAESKLRKITVTRTDPTAGIWDMHLLGVPRYKQSQFKLTVDYVTGQASTAKIEATVQTLKGSFDWSLIQASVPVAPDVKLSTFELTSLFTARQEQVQDQSGIFVAGPQNGFFTYTREATKVKFTTGKSTGNDLDMLVLECPPTVLTPDDPTCEPKGVSGGATDVEAVEFEPKPNRLYAVRVEGYSIKDEGFFEFTESLQMAHEQGTLSVSDNAHAFHVGYDFDLEAVTKSKLFTHPLYLTQNYSVEGNITLRSPDGAALVTVPVQVTNDLKPTALVR